MILLTGATGNLGAHLAYKLLENQDNIVCIHRKSSSFDNIKRIFALYDNEPEKIFSRIIWRKADITNLAELDEAFDGIDRIFNCAAMIDLNNKNYELAYDINVRGTANLVNLSLKYDIKKFLHVSSIAALAETQGRLTTENDILNPSLTNSVYSLTKYYGEKQIWRGVGEGLNAVVVNPSIILAPYKINNFVKLFFKHLKKNGLKYYTTGMKGYVDVEDVANIMVKLMDSDISNERFIISSQNLRFKDIFDFMNEFWGHPPTKKELKKSNLDLIKFLAQMTIFGRKLFTSQTVKYLINDEAYSNEKIMSAIDYKFKDIKTSVFDILKILDKEL